MTDRDALYRGVLEHPDDDTPRLVFADWFDEHGEPERATFIRCQIAIAAFATLGDTIDGPLRSRERALFDAHGEEWFGEDAHLSGLPTASVRLPIIVPARGFPAHWYGPWERWVGGGECSRCADDRRHARRYESEGELIAAAEREHVALLCRHCDGFGRIPGACETLAWRRGWDMECGTCKVEGRVESPNPQFTRRCPECEGQPGGDDYRCSGRVPRPVPSGAVPLETVTLTTMPNRFVEDGNFGLERCAVRIPAVRVPDDGAVEKELCEAEWPGLVFNLPSVNRG